MHRGKHYDCPLSFDSKDIMMVTRSESVERMHGIMLLIRTGTVIEASGGL